METFWCPFLKDDEKSRDAFPLALPSAGTIPASLGELWSITLQAATRVSGSLYIPVAVFVSDKFSAYETHMSWWPFPMLWAIIRKAFLEGGNWWWVKDNICNVMLLLRFLHCDFCHLQSQQSSLETDSSKAICLWGWYTSHTSEGTSRNPSQLPCPPGWQPRANKG